MITTIKHWRRGAALAALVTLTSLPASAQVAVRKGLTLDGARAIATAAATEARRLGAGGAMSAQQDDDIATVAANSVSATASTAAMDRVTFIEAAKTTAAFAKGQPLIETPAFKIHASRRESAGMAEVHTRDTDVIYVLDGRATIVTGGTVVDGRTTAPDELRGARIEGGTARTLAKGDVLIVPEGVPHWFSEVKGPLLYYVVKVTLPAGATPTAITAAATAAATAATTTGGAR